MIARRALHSNWKLQYPSTGDTSGARKGCIGLGTVFGLASCLDVPFLPLGTITPAALACTPALGPFLRC
jgi:hypothetical protein